MSRVAAASVPLLAGLLLAACGDPDPGSPDGETGDGPMVAARVIGRPQDIRVFARDGAGPWALVERDIDGLYRFVVRSGRYSLGAVCLLEDLRTLAVAHAVDTEVLTLTLDLCTGGALVGATRRIHGAVALPEGAYANVLIGGPGEYSYAAFDARSGAYEADLPDTPGAEALFVSFEDTAVGGGLQWLAQRDLPLGDVDLDVNLVTGGKPLVLRDIPVADASVQAQVSGTFVRGAHRVWFGGNAVDPAGVAAVRTPRPADLDATDRLVFHASELEHGDEESMQRAVDRRVGAADLDGLALALPPAVTGVTWGVDRTAGRPIAHAELDAYLPGSSYAMALNDHVLVAVTPGYAGGDAVIELATPDPAELEPLGIWDANLDALIARDAARIVVGATRATADLVESCARYEDEVDGGAPRRPAREPAARIDVDPR